MENCLLSNLNKMLWCPESESAINYSVALPPVIRKTTSFECSVKYIVMYWRGKQIQYSGVTSTCLQKPLTKVTHTHSALPLDAPIICMHINGFCL